MMDDDSNDDNHSDDSNDDNHSDDSNDDNHSDDSNDDNHSDDSNRSSCWSDLDASENYVEFLERLKRHEEYWNKLGHGILSHPAPLQVQCLLSIVGNLDEFPSTVLGLLPAHLRRKLLLILPVVDVCKLEGTPLTDGILMDDIWESLYHARMPNEESNLAHLVRKPKSISKCYGGIICNWKEAYFQNFFSIINYMYYPQTEIPDDDLDYDHCDCIYRHIISDMLYGVYRNDGVSLDAYCFNDSSSQSVHNVYRYAEECPRFTRYVYLDKVATNMSADSKHHIYDLVELFSIVPAPFKILILDMDLAKLWKHFWDVYHLPSASSCEHISLPFSCLFSSLEALSLDGFGHGFGIDHFDSQILKLLVHSIFTSQCKLNAIFLSNSNIYNVVYPYLVKPDCSSLKILHLHCITIFHSILRHHDELQSLHITFNSMMELKTTDHHDIQDLIQSIICLMQRPLLRDLCFYYRNLDPIQFQLIDILRQFFSSPYSITLQIHNAKFEDCFITDEPPFEVTNMSSKSLVFVRSSFPQSICNLLPSDMHFGNLRLCYVTSWKHLVKFDSISVDGVFKLTLDEIDSEDIFSLFRISTATEWEIDVHLNNSDTLESFTNALLIIKGKINCLLLRDIGTFHSPDVLLLLEVIFKQVDSSLPPYFKLEIVADLKKDVLQSIHDVWKKCGAVQLKKIQLRVDDRHVNETYIILPVLSKMAVNISCDACI
jgi:hypothetical protein